MYRTNIWLDDKQRKKLLALSKETGAPVSALIRKAIEAYLRSSTMSNATVRIVRRGDKHPYVIEVVTPGWRGVDAAFKGRGIRSTFPKELKEITGILRKANAKYYSVGDPPKEGVMTFSADGSTEFVFRDAVNFQLAVEALTKARWLTLKDVIKATEGTGEPPSWAVRDEQERMNRD